MKCVFTFYSIVFQSYQDDGRVIKKDVCSGIPFTLEKFRLQPDPDRSLILIRLSMGIDSLVIEGGLT